jgi:hypothetical protein
MYNSLRDQIPITKGVHSMAKRGRPRKAKSGIDLTKLSKGYIRKLTALRKSLGDTIADSAFVTWLSQQPDSATANGDKHAARIAEVLTPLALKKGLKIPKAGYVIRRGRGRVIVDEVPPK